MRRFFLPNSIVRYPPFCYWAGKHHSRGLVTHPTLNAPLCNRAQHFFHVVAKKSGISAPVSIFRESKEQQRIAKLLARAGIASRREVERMIAEGRVALNGVVIDTPATILTSLHGVTVDGAPVQAAAPARLFLYHKPSGLLVTERDPGGRPTIYDKLPGDLPRVVPVGRLDLNTEGLLLLTTDGELKRQLELPATGVERAYRARAYGAVTQAQLEELIHGVEIEGVRYGSINANLERRTGANVWIEMILTEGKNREVRRVLEHLGLRVSRLIRTRYGPFVLGDLPPGEVGEVRQHDVIAFRKNPTRNITPDNSPPELKPRAPAPSPVPGDRLKQPRGVTPQRRPSPRHDERPAAARDARPAPEGPKRVVRPARITREDAANADRAAFDVRGPRRTARGEDKASTWSPRDSRPAEERAARPAPAGVKPKRFYDAKPKGGGKAAPPTDARPARVFNPELGRNVRAKPPRPPREDAPSDARPGGKPRPKTGWAKPKPKPRTRK
jgi:23S rRNA pseudouridine2605 synthase